MKMKMKNPRLRFIDEVKRPGVKPRFSGFRFSGHAFLCSDNMAERIVYLSGEIRIIPNGDSVRTERSYIV